MLRRVKPVLFAAGVVLLVGSLLGARLLTQGADAAVEQKTAAPPSAKPAGGGGPVVIGWVDSDPPPVGHGLPPAMQSGLVVKVFVKEGDTVAANDPLFEFDPSLQEAALKQAKAAVEVAQAKRAIAVQAEAQHLKQVDVSKQVVAAAKMKEELAKKAYWVGETATKDGYRAKNIPEDRWPKLIEEDVELFKLNAAYQQATLERQVRERELAALESAQPGLHTKEAAAGLQQAEAAVAQAQAALELCTVRSKVAGVVEQVSISAGTVLGVASRNPAIWLVPSGPRVIRAEVEAEFAHRVGPDRIGKEVTITDHSDTRPDTKAVYKGVVRRLGNSFLEKRYGSGALNVSDTRVLEAVIEVADATPAGKPPLRVGQKVRVNFGQ